MAKKPKKENLILIDNNKRFSSLDNSKHLNYIVLSSELYNSIEFTTELDNLIKL